MHPSPRVLTGLLVPPRCATCGAACDPRRALCRPCNSEIACATALLARPGPPGVEVVLSAGPHEGALRSLVTSLKFARRLPLAARGAAAIRAAAEPRGLLCGGIVPVPPDPIRLRVRGFDPAEEIARALARSSGLRLERCLERRTGRPQVGRPKRQRLAEPPRIEAWRAPPRVALLVDDVWTTGATLGACAAALRQSGSERVVALTVAHAI
ncbi:MAG: ComF family protein [Solirubrobacterales bacterium]